MHTVRDSSNIVRDTAGDNSYYQRLILSLEIPLDIILTVRDKALLEIIIMLSETNSNIRDNSLIEIILTVN